MAGMNGFNGSGVGAGGGYPSVGVVPTMGFADGGEVDDDSYTVDPMAFVQSALNYGRQQYGIPSDSGGDMGFQDGGVVPTAPDDGDVTGGGNAPVDPRQAMAYLSGDGAVSPEIAQALEQRVDPEGQLNPTQRASLAVMEAPTDEARFGMLQHYRTRYNAYAGAARAALQRGDTGEAARAATMAMDAVPNGQRTQFAPSPNGGLAMMTKPAFPKQQQRPTQSFQDGGPVEDDEYYQNLQPQASGTPVMETEEEAALQRTQPQASGTYKWEQPDTEAPTESYPQPQPMTPAESAAAPSPVQTLSPQDVTAILNRGFDGNLKSQPAIASPSMGGGAMSATALDQAAAEQNAQAGGWGSAAEQTKAAAQSDEVGPLIRPGSVIDRLRASLFPDKPLARTTGSEAATREPEYDNPAAASAASVAAQRAASGAATAPAEPTSFEERYARNEILADQVRLKGPELDAYLRSLGIDPQTPRTWEPYKPLTANAPPPGPGETDITIVHRNPRTGTERSQNFRVLGVPGTPGMTPYSGAQAGAGPQAGAVVDENRVNPFTGQVRPAAPGTYGSREGATRGGGVVPTGATAPYRPTEAELPTGNFGNSIGTLNIRTQPQNLGVFANRGGAPAPPETDFQRQIREAREIAAESHPWIGQDAAARAAATDKNIAAVYARQQAESTANISADKARDAALLAADRAADRNESMLEKQRLANKGALDKVDRQNAARRDEMMVRYAMSQDKNRATALAGLIKEQVRADSRILTDGGITAMARLKGPLEAMGIPATPDHAIAAVRAALGYPPLEAAGTTGVVPTTGGGASAYDQAAKYNLSVGQEVPVTGGDGKIYVGVVGSKGMMSLKKNPDGSPVIFGR